MPNTPMTVTSRNATIRDFLIFQVKLTLDGFKDLVAFNLSIGAILLDFLSGRGQRPRLFYSVVRASERFDRWLNLHGAVRRNEGDGVPDPSVTEVDDDSIVTEIERLIGSQTLSRDEVIRRLKAGTDALRGRDAETNSNS